MSAGVLEVIPEGWIKVAFLSAVYCCSHPSTPQGPMAVSTQRCFFACRRTEQDAMIRKQTCTCTRASYASNQLARPARPLEDGERQCVVRRITWQGFAPALTTTILAEVSAIPTNPAETASKPQGRGLETTGLDWTVASRLWAIYELNSNKEPAIVLGEAILHPVWLGSIVCKYISC